MVEVAFAGAVCTSGIPAVDAPSFGTNLLFVSFILAESEASLPIAFGATVAEDLFASGKISFARFVASDGLCSPCDLVSSVCWFLYVLVVLAEEATTFEEFEAVEKELVFGAAFLEAFAGAGGRGLIFNSESGSTPAPIGLK